MMQETKNLYWINQYSNPYIMQAYEQTLGAEICKNISIDYIFIGVGSGGTIAGVSKKVKEIYPNAIVVAVDSCGSLIFDCSPKKRFIPGIGSSFRPTLLSNAVFDEVVFIEEYDAITSCREFLHENHLLIGGSSGSVYMAIKQYFEGKAFPQKPNVVAIFADQGDRYIDTVYNDDWVYERYDKYPQTN